MSRTTGTFFAIADRTPMGDFSVICHRCWTCFGTMDAVTLRAAIFSTSTRGGVLCPDCRAKACHYCGADTRNSNGLCSLCDLQLAATDSGRPCLSIVHNSTNVPDIE